jgi:hypothetical protein
VSFEAAIFSYLLSIGFGKGCGDCAFRYSVAVGAVMSFRMDAIYAGTPRNFVKFITKDHDFLADFPKNPLQL